MSEVIIGHHSPIDGMFHDLCSLGRFLLQVAAIVRCGRGTYHSACIAELESSADADDERGGQSREGADAPGAPSVAADVTGAGQAADARPHQQRQDLHHHQGQQ